MRPFRVRWFNKSGNGVWVDFQPDIVLVTPDEAAAVRFAVDRRLVGGEKVLMAIELSWEEYEAWRTSSK